MSGCKKNDAAAGAGAADAVKVGVLHSLSGTMAISEVTVKNSTQLAIDEINAAGGVNGKKIQAVTEDGASDPATFAQKASKLIDDDGVVTVFGGWTSSSRKAMLPVFEKTKNLLWYPVQFEGNECSPNIMYSGAQPNQQILPAYDWAKQKGFKKIFLVGSDYVFPRTANLILKKHIEHDGLTMSGEEYQPMGGTDFSGVVAKIRAAKPDVIFNTLNGDSNVAFFKQMAAAGMKSDVIPVMSFSIGEQEAQAMGPSLVEGSYAGWNYFQTLDNPENAKFVAAYKAKFGADAVVTDPMVHGYLDVYVWKAAAEKAKSFDPAKVRAAAVTLDAVPTPLGTVKFAANNSLVQTGYIGQADPKGQFKILWTSPGMIDPNPYDALAFPGKTCTIS
ncbi:urea ABC transporter substrate-binding protein [Flavisphingomonas formosensis]|uniref:urea ABC transporter substrate-binding protein n=1 Tax=Flavisphingomonas formosensis TaxID=861534 RepID=UPI0038CD189F